MKISNDFKKIFFSVNWQLVIHLIAGGVILVVLTSYITLQNVNNKQKNEKGANFEERYIISMDEEDIFEEDPGQKAIMIVVDVKGEVNNPDVYELELGTRVSDAIEAAGGLTDNADRNEVNMATKLYDAMDITVPAINVKTSSTKSTSSKSGSSSAKAQPVDTSTLMVNINTAGVNELMQLSGIGPALANYIVMFREENGPFKSVEQLLAIPGIGSATFAGFRNNITI